MSVAEQRTSTVALVSLANGVLTIAFALIWTTVLARTLPPAEFGRFTWIWSILGFSCVIGALGMPGFLVPYLVQRRYALGRAAPAHSFEVCIWQTYAIPLLFSLAAGSVVAAVSMMMNGQQTALWALLLPCLVLHAVAIATARGLGRPLIAGALDGWGRFAVSSFAIVVAVSVADAHPDAENALFIAAQATVLAGVIALVLSVRTLRELQSAEPDSCVKFAVVTKRAAPFLWSSLGLAVLTTSDAIIAGIFLPLEHVGFYKLAVQLSVVLVAATTVLGAAFSERFATLWQGGDQNALAELLGRLSLLTFSIALAVAIPILLLRDWLVITLFGADYLESTPILMILLAYRVVDSYFGPVITVLNSIGRQHFVSVVMLQSAVLAVVAQIALSAIFGVLGLAMATAASGIALKGRLWVEWRRVRRQHAGSGDG
jgi:O-antigen/teichoic acid export membrane protein